MVILVLESFFACSFAVGSDVGEGYGQTLRPLFSARQAGTGGISLEENWRQGSFLEANTVLLDQGLRWMGIGLEGGLGATLRASAEVFSFTSSNVTQTYENPDGTFAGERGGKSVDEIGGRATGRLAVWNSPDWTIQALARLNGLYQKLPDYNTSGFGLEAGLQGKRRIGDGNSLVLWG